MTDRLVGPVAEDRLRGRAPADDAAARVHRDHGVERGVEHRAHSRLARTNSRLRMPSRHELPDVAPEDAHRVENPLIRRAQLAGEELHHADDPARARERESEGGVKPRAAGGVRAWE